MGLVDILALSVGAPATTVLLFWLLSRAKRPRRLASADADVLLEAQTAIGALRKQVYDLRQQHDTLEMAFKSFRGKVYAWRGRLEVEEQPAPAPAGRGPVDLTDPSLTKAQVKAALGITTPAGAAAFMKGAKGN